MDKFLFEAASRGHLIITVNDRLARHLLQGYDRCMQDAGRVAWVRPQVLSLAAWLGRCRHLLPDALGLLSPVQCQRVWELIVAEDSERSDNPLLQVPQTARRAHQAHQLLLRHAVDFRPEEGAEDHRAFLRWRHAWQQMSAERGWHDSAELPWLLSAAVTEKQIAAPERLVLAGFDELPPDLLHLCETLRRHGTAIDPWQPQLHTDNLCRRTTGLDPADEVRRCARWARRILADRPAAAIGIVAPQLEAYQPLIERIFLEELDPQALLQGEETPQVFNMSLGHGLDREGVVATALTLLRTGSKLDFATLSWLLRSPYLGAAEEEGTGRALVESELRRTGRTEWSLARLAGTLDRLVKRTGHAVPGMQQFVEVLRSDLARPIKRMPGDWAEHFARLLHRLGWPGARVLSSREHQAIQNFREVLGEMASIDRVSGTLGREAASGLLARMAGSCSFQPEGAESRIQILGSLESAGLTFDHLWVLGLHDKALPSPPAPNPFIPLPVQRRERMKRADAERESLFAVQLAGRLFRAAPDVVLSWPLQDDSGGLRPSSMIVDFPEDEPPMLCSHAPTLLLHASRPTLEEIVDQKAPPVCSRKPFNGGTGILKDQALCPFRAFAHHRLRSEGLEAPEIGVDNMSRGSLAHSVLEYFWKATETQEALLALDEDSLLAQLDESAAKAIERLEKEKRCDLPQRQKTIEQQRLVRLVRQWLECEKLRGAFRVVASESIHQLTIGNLQIRSRVDRIDQLADGRHAIIDYKTGKVDPLQWLQDRITEPQLPAYSLGLADNKLDAVMFAVVRGKENECGFRGLARNGDAWPQDATPRGAAALFAEKGWLGFEDVLAHWQRTLPALGDAFASGEASVDPINRKQACTYCDLTPLCRVSEQDLHATGTEDGDD